LTCLFLFPAIATKCKQWRCKAAEPGAHQNCFLPLQIPHRDFSSNSLLPSPFNRKPNTNRDRGFVLLSSFFFPFCPFCKPGLFFHLSLLHTSLLALSEETVWGLRRGGSPFVLPYCTLHIEPDR